jgi:ATP-binding cassette, subfamily C, bacterial CydD
VRPVDQRLLRASPAARRFVAACVPLALATALTIVAQATLLGLIVADVFIKHRGLGDVATPLALLAAVALARGVLAWAFEAGGHLTASATAGALRRRLVRHALGDRPGDPAMTSGEVTTAAVSGVDALDPYFARYLPQLVLGAVVPLVILVRVATLDVLSAVVMAATIPLIPLFGALVGRTTGERARARYAALAGLASHFLNVVGGLTTLRAFNRGAIQAELLAESGERYRKETMGTLRIAFLSALVLELAATLGTAVVAVEIGIRLDGAGIGLAPALTILVLAPELYAPLRTAAAQFHASADGVAAAGHILAPIEAAAVVAAPGRAAPLDPRDVPVRLDRVSFAYPGRAGTVVDDVSLTLAPGERVALVGPSGSGKSTIARLLLGFDRPERGRLLIGGSELGEIDAEAWRRQLAWMPQRPHLARGTIADAIRLGSPDASIADVADAARRAGAESFIAALPDGYGTHVGDGCAGLSAGQLRRIAFARALLRDASLLILDEPTTNLDDESAGVVADALVRLPRGATMLLITHDEALAQRVADRVVRLSAGRRAELTA